MVSFTPRLLYPTAKESTVPIDRSGGPQNESTLFREEQIIVPVPGM